MNSAVTIQGPEVTIHPWMTKAPIECKAKPLKMAGKTSQKAPMVATLLCYGKYTLVIMSLPTYF